MRVTQVLCNASKHPKMGYQKLAGHYSIGKTAISGIFKDSENLRRDNDFFKGSYRNCCHGKYDLMNEV